MHAAHVLFKGQVVCSSDDGNIRDIYDRILSFNPLASTEEVCELEEVSDQQIVLTRGTEGFFERTSKIDSTSKGKEGQSLSFGSGFFHGVHCRGGSGTSLHYVNSNYFYAVPIDKKNTTTIFLPEVNPLVSINSGGEWHPRTFLWGAYGDVVVIVWDFIRRVKG